MHYAAYAEPEIPNQWTINRLRALSHDLSTHVPDPVSIGTTQRVHIDGPRCTVPTLTPLPFIEISSSRHVPYKANADTAFNADVELDVGHQLMPMLTLTLTLTLTLILPLTLTLPLPLTLTLILTHSRGGTMH